MNTVKPRINPIQAALQSQSRVFGVFEETEKLTISEVHHRVNDRASPTDRLSERTVRRSIEALVENGFLKPQGKQNNAIVYGKLSASFTDLDEKLINFGGQLVSIETFIKSVVDEDSAPLQKSKVRMLSVDMETQIRRRLAFVLLSSGEVGMNDQLEKARRELFKALDELKYAVNVLENFTSSPVWYGQYRDKIARGMRELQKNDPDLFQKTIEYVRGEA